MLILTCTGVSFAHGSNDGQKGMGLIMLILIGVMPTAYALNRAVPDSQAELFWRCQPTSAQTLDRYSEGRTAPDPRAIASTYLRTRRPILRSFRRSPRWSREHPAQVAAVRIPATASRRRGGERAQRHVSRIGDDSSLGGTATPAFVPRDAQLLACTAATSTSPPGSYPVGEDRGCHRPRPRHHGRLETDRRHGRREIGKTHLTYAQGASAELVAATTIAAADIFGLPVSTTHVLSSGVAGTMAASRSGLQRSTVRNLAIAWVLTLPAAIVLAGTLFWFFSKLF